MFGPSLLSAAIGVQVMLAGMLLAKPPGRRVADLAALGEKVFYPEHDVLIYLTGIAGTLALVWLLASNGRQCPPSLGTQPRFAIFQAVVALGTTAVFLLAFLSARTYPLRGLHVPGRYPAFFAATVALCLAVALAGRMGRRNDLAGAGDRTTPTAEHPFPARLRPSVWDLIVVVSIVALVYVPNWRQVSGKVFMEEGLLHWDFFSMAPALAFRHGQALGSDFLLNYGAGWPMFFSVVSGWLPLSYGRMIQIGSIYICLYFAGVYLLLRLLTGRPFLSAAGTGLAVLTMFISPFGLYLWRAPNVTPMRWAFDVWCFIAAVLWWKSEKRVWLAVAGALVGLAVVFNIRSGIELAAAFAFYCVCTTRLRGDRPRRWADVAVAGAAAVGVALTGLAVAGHGQILTPGFWTAWLNEPLYFLMLPLATIPVPATIVRFSLICLFYLSVTGYCLARLANRRASGHRTGHFEVFNGFVALYGLFELIKFVHHSADMTFPRLLIPAVIIATNLAGRAVTRFEQWVRRTWSDSKRGRMLLRWPYALAGVVVVGAVAAPRGLLVDPVLAYPSLLSARVNGRQPDGLCLMREPKDICGLPEAMDGSAPQFRAISDSLRALKAEGETVAVLDESGSLFYLAGGIAPFGSYPRIFMSSYTKELQQGVERGLLEKPPDYILIRTALQSGTHEYEQWAAFGPGPSPDSYYPDTWARLEAIVQRDYQLQSRMPPFELWRRGPQVPSGTRF